jgi:protein-S-isoprenylcysteine O-methyltransferase Ste14
LSRITTGDLKMSMLQKIRETLLRISGYLVPLIQQIPTLGIYTGLMTLPLLSVLTILFTQFPVNIIGMIAEFITMSFMSVSVLVANLITIAGLLLTIYSVIYFMCHKKDGLVTTGPYRFIRHPQYTGFLMITLGLTVFSYWWLSNTFGIGWLSKEATVAVWFVQLGVYVALALIEESHLLKTFGEHYNTYKKTASFFVPLGRFKRFDIPFSVGILILSMILLILTQSLGSPFVFS